MPRSGDGREVTCPACGRQVERRDAREYDKFGNERGRRAEVVEYLCRACFDDLTHEARDDLEAILVDINAGGCDRETFLRRYRRITLGRRGRRRDQ